MNAAADLLSREPERWGLRGDRPLWIALRAELAGAPWPDDWYTLTTLVEAGYARIVGRELPEHPGEHDHVVAPHLAVGHGMSDGLVSPHFWRHTAIPIVIDRWAGLRRRP